MDKKRLLQFTQRFFHFGISTMVFSKLVYDPTDDVGNGDPQALGFLL